MQPSHPNEHGVFPIGHSETIARRGLAYVMLTFAMNQDGLVRYGLQLRYSYGGLSSPISIHRPSFETLEAARIAAIEDLLRFWHEPFPSAPASVRLELRDLREQVEAHLRQPSLF